MFSQNDTIDRYQEIRKKGMELNSKYLKYFSAQDMRIASRILGVLKGKKMILSSEEDMGRCCDFFVNDYKNNEGKNLIEIYKEKNNNHTEEEISIINASLSSRASLYEVVSSNYQYKTIKIKSLLNMDSEIIDVIDVGFSSTTLIHKLIIYTRIVSFSDFNITSGAPLLFDDNYKDIILDKYEKKMAKIIVGDEQTRRAAAFFQLYQKYGYKSMGYM